VAPSVGRDGKRLDPADQRTRGVQAEHRPDHDDEQGGERESEHAQQHQARRGRKERRDVHHRPDRSAVRGRQRRGVRRADQAPSGYGPSALQHRRGQSAISPGGRADDEGRIALGVRGRLALPVQVAIVEPHVGGGVEHQRVAVRRLRDADREGPGHLAHADRAFDVRLKCARVGVRLEELGGDGAHRLGDEPMNATVRVQHALREEDEADHLQHDHGRQCDAHVDRAQQPSQPAVPASLTVARTEPGADAVRRVTGTCATRHRVAGTIVVDRRRRGTRSIGHDSNLATPRHRRERRAEAVARDRRSRPLRASGPGRPGPEARRPERRQDRAETVRKNRPGRASGPMRETGARRYAQARLAGRT